MLFEHVEIFRAFGSSFKKDLSGIHIDLPGIAYTDFGATGEL